MAPDSDEEPLKDIPLPLSSSDPPVAQLSLLERAFTGLQLLSPYRYLRRDLEEQLNRRTISTLDAWSAFDIPTDLIIDVSDIIYKYMDWPNSHFLPDDPLLFLLCEEVEDFRTLSCIRAITKAYHLPKGFFRQAHNETLLVFLKRIAAQVGQ